MPWDPDSRASLARHIDDIDWVIPALASVTGGGSIRTYDPDPQFQAVVRHNVDPPRVMPMIQNAAADKWDGAGMGAILRSPTRRAALLDWAERIVRNQNGSGIVFDLEELPANALPSYQAFLGEVRARFAPRRWEVALAVPLDNPDWDLPDLCARWPTILFLMNYDEHSPGEVAGPIAAQSWFVGNLKRTLAQIPPGKAIVAIGNYAYDWHDGIGRQHDRRRSLARRQRQRRAAGVRSGIGQQPFRLCGERVEARSLDARCGKRVEPAARGQGRGCGGLCACGGSGSEDVGYWSAAKALPTGRTPDLSHFTPVGNVDVQGAGELLRIEATPRDGLRRIDFDKAGLIRNQQFTQLPTPFVVRRGGNRPGMIALTFDDGPDATWTPKILDVLEAKTRARHLLCHRRECAVEPRPAQPDCCGRQ